MKNIDNEQKDNMYTKSGRDIFPVPKNRKNVAAKNFSDIGGSTISGEKMHNNKLYKKEIPISQVYPVIDTDLARDNIENDLTAADLQDLERPTRS